MVGGVVDGDVVDVLLLFDDGAVVLASELVAGLDGVRAPGRPEEAVLEHGDGVRVLDDALEDDAAVGAIETHAFDGSLLSVGPVEAGIGQVEGEAIGPADIAGNERSGVATVHESAPDLGMVAPVGPVHFAENKIFSVRVFQSDMRTYILSEQIYSFYFVEASASILKIRMHYFYI